ncbi:MAG: methyltransferase type 11, partial [Sphingobacteriales bacterium]
FGKNPFYVTAHFYTPQDLINNIDKALAGRQYDLEWTCAGLPKWFPVQQWSLPFGDFFGLYVRFTDTDG